jgi:broad specificity phosphatase PhoE
MRQIIRKGIGRVLIVSHGLTLRCFVMRFLHLSVEQFEAINNPSNCDVITLADKNTIESPQFTWGTWGVTGLRMVSAPPPRPHE